MTLETRKSLVSLIVPNKNNGEFLRDSLNSINEQTYKNIEIILIDSNSKDDSSIIAKTTKNVKFYQQEDKSPSHAVAIGISKASGEFLMFLTSTDLLLDKEFIEKSVEILNSDDSISLVYGNHGVFKDNKIEIPPKNKWNLSAYSHGKLFLHWLITSETFIEMSYIIRSKVALNCVGNLESYDINFNESDEDILNNLKLNFMKLGYITKHIPMRVVAFRIHEGQISGSSESLKIFHKHMKKYFDDCNLIRRKVLEERKFYFLNSNSENIESIRINKEIVLLKRFIYRGITKTKMVLEKF